MGWHGAPRASLGGVPGVPGLSGEGFSFGPPEKGRHGAQASGTGQEVSIGTVAVSVPLLVSLRTRHPQSLTPSNFGGSLGPGYLQRVLAIVGITQGLWQPHQF
jgi:hypothetical protein